MSVEKPPKLDKSFEEEASEGQSGFLAEFGTFLLYNTKWWLTPIIVVILLIGLAVMLGGSGVAPFIYAIF